MQTNRTLPLWGFLVGAAGLAQAQEQQAGQPGEEVEEFVVTGSYIPRLSQFDAPAPLTTIGRASTNLIELTDTYCSAEHARVVWRDGQWWLEDRDSRNGTRLNEEIVDVPVVLSAGDVIRIGHAQMRFETDASL